MSIKGKKENKFYVNNNANYIFILIKQKVSILSQGAEPKIVTYQAAVQRYGHVNIPQDIVKVSKPNGDEIFKMANDTVVMGSTVSSGQPVSTIVYKVYTTNISYCKFLYMT